MSHPFGDLINQHLHRKHGLSQAKLAEGILQDPSIIGKMCKGERLHGPQARERVCAIIDWLRQHAVLTTVEEANQLLSAAGMSSLRAEESNEARLLQHLRAQSLSPTLPATPRLPTTTTPRTNLPVSITSFVGRAEAVLEVSHLVANHRLVTLTGAGGVGKTRLAVEVGKAILDFGFWILDSVATAANNPKSKIQNPKFPDGVWFVDLVPLSDPQAIPQRILDLWRVPEQPERSPLESLIAYLSAKKILLILDNCEHLIVACAELAETLLQHCPHLSFLATSREVLNIGGETPWRVPSLTRPPAGSSWEGQPAAVRPAFTPETLADFEAVTLFVERVTLRQPSFALTTTNAPAVAQICSRLDGIPLALEMAAARINVFTVEEMARRLAGVFDERFQMLINGVRTAPMRHQTLRATLEWSYSLLTPAEQRLLVCLSVFSGGWTAAAVEEVTGCSLDLLAQLVNKSLVIADQQGGQTRYRLLETVRQFAGTQLAATQQGVANLFTMAYQQHLHYYMSLAEEIEPRLRVGPQVAQAYAQLEAEHDNLRAAISWALHNAEWTLAARIVAALHDFWAARGYLQEGQTQAERVLAQSAAISATERVRLLMTAGGLAANQHNYRIAQPLLAESEAIARALGTLGQFTLARICIDWGWTKIEFLDFAAAQWYGQEALALGQTLDDPWVCGESLIVLGAIAKDQGDYETARQHLGAAVACTQSLGCTLVYGNALSNLGILLVDQGDYQNADAHLGQSVAIFEQLGHRLALAWSLLGLGDMAAALDNTTQAEQFYEQALTIQRALQDLEHASVTLEAMARLAKCQGDYPRSRALLYESLAITVEMGHRPKIVHILDAISDLEATQGQTERRPHLGCCRSS